jgi:hypothetical protein
MFDVDPLQHVSKLTILDISMPVSHPICLVFVCQNWPNTIASVLQVASLQCVMDCGLGDANLEVQGPNVLAVLEWYGRHPHRNLPGTASAR